MITYVAGNLFTSPAKVLVNTVNTQGVMGKGIALQFKKIYPDMFKKYQQFCESGEIDIGVLWIYKTPHKWILNFPTKKHWRNSSKIEYIESGLEKFSEKFIDLAIHSIAFPALGCGNGELDWEETVKPVMESYLNRIPIDIFVHPPIPVKELPEHKKKAEIEKWLRSEPRSLAFSEVWEDVSEVLSNKSRFRTTTGNEFEAKTQIDKESDSDSKFLVIKTKNRNYRIDYHQLSDLWQQFRQHGVSKTRDRAKLARA